MTLLLEGLDIARVGAGDVLCSLVGHGDAAAASPGGSSAPEAWGETTVPLARKFEARITTFEVRPLRYRGELAGSRRRSTALFLKKCARVWMCACRGGSSAATPHPVKTALGPGKIHP